MSDPRDVEEVWGCVQCGCIRCECPEDDSAILALIELRDHINNQIDKLRQERK